MPLAEFISQVTDFGVELYLPGHIHPVHVVPWGDECRTYFDTLGPYFSSFHTAEQALLLDAAQHGKLPGPVHAALMTWQAELAAEVPRSERTAVLIPLPYDPAKPHISRYQLLSGEEYRALLAQRELTLQSRPSGART